MSWGKIIKKRSLKLKLVITYFAIICVIVFIFEASFLLGIREYYYGNIEQLLKHNIYTTVSIYDNKLINASLENKAKVLLENEVIPEYVDAQILDTEGNILESSSRIPNDEIISSPDYLSCLNNEFLAWKAYSKSSNEYIMAVSVPLYKNKHIEGAIRFITSLEDVNENLMKFYALLIGIGLLIILFTFMISIFLSSKIVKPIENLKNVANRYARGHFDERAIVFSNDELGELSEAFNYMAKEIKSAEDIKTNFISSISHEIRTPLTSISAWGETLLNGYDDDEEQKMGLEIISKESERLTGLVEKLLDFSKLEADRLVPDMNFFDIKELVEKTVKQFSKFAQQRKIQILIKSKLKKINFYGDEYRLKQVLINVIDNAIKHSYAQGKIKISLLIEDYQSMIHFLDNENKLNSIEIFDKETYEKYLLIKVQDNGEGIQEEHIDKLTKLFYKGNEKKEGSGIGLAVSKKIIDLHKGYITFKKNESQGTSVYIYLPMRKKETI